MTREEIWSNIEKLSELRSEYSCFDEKEEPFYHALSLGIKGIKALEQEPKWIPVSDKLPEDGAYLVTVERMCGTPSVNIRSFSKNLYSVDKYDFHNKNGKSGWYDYDSEYGYWEETDVIAWMPLPKPYEPQEREDNG